MRVLVVEPTKFYQQLLRTLFIDLGYEVLLAAGAEGAMARLDGVEVELVCLAYHLEDLDGIELSRRIRDQRRLQGTPILMLTSSGSVIDARDALRSGVTEIFDKTALGEFTNYVFNFAEQNRSEMEGRLLYVEDNRATAAVTLETIRATGLEVDHFTSAEAALEAYERNDYDLVLTDIVLEGQKSGLSLIVGVRRKPGRRGQVPVLAVSGYHDDARKLELIRVGATDFVSKPVLSDELLIRIRTLIRNKRLLDQVEEQQERLTHLAMTDQLTDLYNRRVLMEMAPKTLSDARRHRFPVALIGADLDHFKRVNDEHGHVTGDGVLEGVSRVLAAGCRKEDIAVRMGGEEFVLLLVHCPPEEALAKAENLRTSIQALNPEGIPVTASFGVTWYQPGGDDAVDDDEALFARLIQAADRALYRAKGRGRNRVESLALEES